MSRATINWTPDMDALLGQDEDNAIASRLYAKYPLLSISPKLVKERRKALGIEGYGRNKSKPASGKRKHPRVSSTPPWTPEEDAILGTDTLVKISARLGRPISQIQKRMKQLGVPNFGVRVRPRNPARAAEREAIEERNKVRFERGMRAGMAVAVFITGGHTVTAAGQELGIGVEGARQRLLKFLRALRHPSRLGERLLPSTAWSEIAPWRLIEPHLLTEAVRRMSIELETGSRDVWRDPVPVKVEPGAAPIRA